MRVETRKATQADIPFLLQLRQETMQAYLAASGADCSVDAHLARIAHGFEHAEIVICDGIPCGLLKVSKSPEIWEVVQIQLDRKVQGKGVGRALLEEAIAAAELAGVEIKLSVLKSNPAKRLYERLGFETIGEDAHEYLMQRLP